VSFWLRHLPSLPIVVPLIAGATMIFFAEQRRRPRIVLALTSITLQLVAAVTLLYLTTDRVPDIWPEGIGAYTIGGWAAPFGIVLVVDRLSALMITLNALLALPVIVYSFARWDRVGVHYHALLQFLLVGLNGAFLTGDLFNLFVFFEILLAASYALLLHGGGTQRVKSALHFIVVNLAASFTFLIGVAMIYGVVGTLNLADIAARWPGLSNDDRGIAEAGVTILGIAFLVKAGSWPLNFWLPAAYSAAGAPVAAVFSIATKVGVYAILRVASLLDEPIAPFGGSWLFYAALATMAFGIAGILAARQLQRLVAFNVILSSGTLLAAIGFGSPGILAPALLYLLASVLATGAFFMLTGMTERMRTAGPGEGISATEPASYTAFSVGEPDEFGPDDEVGVALPATMAFLGLAFVSCALLVTGMPPLAGFIAKLGLVSAIVDSLAPDADNAPAWLLVAALLAGGFAGLIALSRIGMRLFWSVTGRTIPRLSVIEAGPVTFLVLLCIALTVGAGPTMTYLDSAARTLHQPQTYIRAVLPDAAAGVHDPETAP
jgi:multicomponent K+:H+ antiporter subunit D